MWIAVALLGFGAFVLTLTFLFALIELISIGQSLRRPIRGHRNGRSRGKTATHV